MKLTKVLLIFARIHLWLRLNALLCLLQWYQIGLSITVHVKVHILISILGYCKKSEQKSGGKKAKP